MATIADKVINENMRVLADLSEVNCLSTGLEEQETIEALKHCIPTCEMSWKSLVHTG